MFNTLNALRIRKLFLLAILLRLLIMPFYFHPDIKTYNFQSQFLKDGVFNIYSFLLENKEKLSSKEEFTYFPLAYLFLGNYQIVMKPFLGNGFSDWLTDASQASTEKVGVYRYLFVLKLPFLILDLSIAFLLIRFFKDRKDKRRAFILWLFNPISISIIYIFSGIDIISVFLSLISILLFTNQKIFLSALVLGLSAGFKPYTLLFLPIFFLFCKNNNQLFKFLLTSIVTVILIVFPFWSPSFFHSALLSGLTTRIAYPGIPIGFGETLMVGVITLSAFYFWIYIKKDKEIDKLIFYILGLFLMLFPTIHFHIQWLIWVIPVLIIASILRKELAKFFFIFLFLAFLIPLLYNDQAMNVSLLSAVSLLYKTLPTVSTIVQKIYDANLLQSVLHSLIFGLGIVMIIKILRIEKI